MSTIAIKQVAIILKFKDNAKLTFNAVQGELILQNVQDIFYQKYLTLVRK